MISIYIGYDPRASNAVHDPVWYQTLPSVAPEVPTRWPEPLEHPLAAAIWREAIEAEMVAGRAPSLVSRVWQKLRSVSDVG